MNIVMGNGNQQWGLSPDMLMIALREDESEPRSQGHCDLQHP